MRTFIVAVMLWSVVVFAWVLFYPAGAGEVLGCMRLLSRSFECEARQQLINELRWQYQTLPTLVGIASGYVGIVIVRMGRVASEASRADSPPG